MKEQEIINGFENKEENITEPVKAIPSENAAKAAKASRPEAKAVRMITVGFLLSCIPLNYFGIIFLSELKYSGILLAAPIIGAILYLFGFRILRMGNKWFGRAYILSVILTAVLFVNAIMNATIYRRWLALSASQCFLILACIIHLIMLFSFAMAIELLFGKDIVEGKLVGSSAAFAWYLLLLFSPILMFPGIAYAVIIFLPVSFIIVLKKLNRLSKIVGSDKCRLKAAPVKLPDGIPAIALLVVLGAGISIGSLFFSEYSMEWTPVDLSENTSSEIYENLISLGYPEEQLNDLSADDLEMLKDAELVVVSQEALSMDQTDTNQENDAVSASAESKGYDLQVTNIAVRLDRNSPDTEQWRIIHHFTINDSVKTMGTANIDIWPVYYYDDQAWYEMDNIYPTSGRLLCRKDGADLTADYKSFYDYWDHGEDDIMYEELELKHFDISGDFTLPDKAENRRGYAAYSVLQQRDDAVLNSSFHYTNQDHLIQFPAKTALEHVVEYDGSSAYPYTTVTSTFKFSVKNIGQEISAGQQ